MRLRQYDGRALLAGPHLVGVNLRIQMVQSAFEVQVQPCLLPSLFQLHPYDMVKLHF